MNSQYELATLAGGCFWCLEAVFDEVKGVLSVESGYSNGHVANPTYRAVCGGDTGHAEVTRIKFDPSVISFRDLLNVFFAIHDPTTMNRQGADVGTQYRSAIFYHSPEQKETAETLISELNAQKIWNSPIVQAAMPIQMFSLSGRPALCAYCAPPSYMRRFIPARPWMNIGMKTMLMQMNDPQKWIAPSVSFIFFPVAFGNQ